MKNVKSLLKLSALFGSLTLSLHAFADEIFVQDGSEYVVKSGVVGVMNMPENAYQQSTKGKLNGKSPSTNKIKGFFSVYDEQGLKQHGAKLADKPKYQVVHKLVRNPHTQKVKEVPALLSGQIIVKTKDVDSIKTSLKLKKGFPDSGFYIYDLNNASVSQALQELSSQPGVEQAKIEVIENLRVPM